MRIALILFAIASAFVVLFYFSNAREERIDTNNYLEVAAAMVRFVDASLDDETETFNLQYRCNAEQEKCAVVHDPSKPPHMGYAIMSLDHVGRATGDERLVAKARRLIDKAVEKCGGDTRFCEWNFFPLHFYAKTTGDERYENAMQKVSDELMRERSVRDLLGNISVKWWLLYDVTGDAKYLDRLVKVADAQLMEYPETRLNDDVVYSYGGGDVRTYDIAILWTLYLPAYKATGDAKYLKPITDFFDAASLENHLDAFFDMASAANLVKAVETLVDVAEIDASRHDAYRAQAEKIVDALLKERWDTPEHKLMNGDYGLLVSPTDKATNMQGWFIHSLLELADVDVNHAY